MSEESLEQWLGSGDYMPEEFRDFHDQKDLFKTIHSTYNGGKGAEDMPNCRDAHIYTVDWFLYFMASRGYTLQKCRKNIEFREYKVIKDNFKPLYDILKGV